MLSLVILFNGALIVFIVSTMFAAGLTTAVADLRAVLRRGRLLVLVLVANLVVVPLLGLGVAEAFGLTAAASAALILVASSPGAPFGAKVAMIQRGDVLTGSVVQVLLAALGSVTFPITANALLTRAGGPGDLDLPVADLLLSVAVLQLVPFGIGLAMKHWTGQTSAGWAPVTQRVSTIAFGAVLALGLASSWEQLVSLIGSRTLIAAAVFSVLAGLAGALLSPGPRRTRTTLAGIAPLRNAGPAFAAVAIGLDNDPAALAALSGILLVGLAVILPVAARLASTRTDTG